MTRRAITLFALVCALAVGAPIAADAASADTAPAAISDQPALAAKLPLRSNRNSFGINKIVASTPPAACDATITA